VHNEAVTDGQFMGGQFFGDQNPGGGQFPGEQIPGEQIPGEQYPGAQTPGAPFPSGQATDPCPQCGSPANVHSIGELAALAQMQLDKMQGAMPQPGGPQQGWNAEPQSGPAPGWAAEPQAGPPPGSRGWSTPRRGLFDGLPEADSIDQAITNVAMGAAARFIGRAVAKKVQQTVTDRVMPAMTQAMTLRQNLLREQIAIAQQHPDVRACMSDNVIFLAGGTRVLPMPNLGTLTAQQADALVAQLRQS
jgi:hypothetical protein